MLVTPAEANLTSNIVDFGDVPLDSDLVLDSTAYLGIINRINAAGDDSGSEVSAFNSSI
jgi:hypothetical protein